MHATFSPTGTRLVPRPASGFYTAPDANGCVLTWAHQEAIAQFKQWCKHADPYSRKVVHATITDLGGFDQVGDVDQQNPAVNLGTNPVSFERAIALPALDAGGNPVPNAQAWDRSKYLVADDTLLDGYYAYLQHNLNVGYIGQQGAVA